MIEVKLYLYDEAEHQAFFQFHCAILAHRRATQAMQHVPMTVEETAPPETADALAPGEARAMDTKIASDAAEARAARVIASITPEGVTKPTTSALEDALRAYYSKHGLAEARKVLAEYGVNRIGEVPAEKHAELLARLQS